MHQSLVLYAEDDPNDVYFVKRAFRSARPDVHIHAVSDGQEAIDYLSKALKPGHGETYPLPNLILLDIKMPKLDGFAVLEWIRKHRELAALPVIMLSSSDRMDDQQAAATLGANYYLKKESLYPDIAEQVKPWLR